MRPTIITNIAIAIGRLILVRILIREGPEIISGGSPFETESQFGNVNRHRCQRYGSPCSDSRVCLSFSLAFYGRWATNSVM
jgi:hypothetical protein